ncbi:MAG TPA: DUF1501 domain-containing protein [Planctomycetota bacterium]|nr:DUF1501 domain-containing protein [Planctomycetota bacterium]
MDCGCGSVERSSSRREFLSRAGGGFGLVALASLMKEDGLLAQDAPAGSLAPRVPHFPPRARNVIFLFMSGGPSHVDLFDYKPELDRLAGQPIPESFGTFKTRRAVAKNKLMPSRWAFRKHGESGMEISDALPHIASCADDLCLLRGCYGDSVTHPESVYLMNTGSILMGRPSLGAWAAYGLGTENQDMPAFVVLPDPAGWVKGGAPAWSNGYLPATYQGTILRGGDTPILHLNNPPGIEAAQQRRTLDLINRLNREPGGAGEEDSELAARIAAYELAFRMQSSAQEVVDLRKETEATRKLYGLDDRVTQEFGLRCLLARRMVERGVRFVQLYCGDTNGWDGHADVEGNHGKLCAASDKPVAGLLKDLKSRGLLDETLVLWGGEFGRTPMTEGSNGRDHNPHGFSLWMAGGGVRGGRVIGATDAVGLRAAEEKTHVHDIHATILHLLGIDHTRLTYRHQGRAQRLTDVAGTVIEKALA